MKYRMGEITALEMREILPARPVVLLPLGSFEDQGPHAPMADCLSAERMAELIAARATARGTRSLVAPVLAYGGADFFGTAPGGIALGQETFRAVLRDMFGCLLRHDIARLIVVNGHAGEYPGGAGYGARDLARTATADPELLSVEDRAGADARDRGGGKNARNEWAWWRSADLDRDAPVPAMDAA